MNVVIAGTAGTAGTWNAHCGCRDTYADWTQTLHEEQPGAELGAWRHAGSVVGSSHERLQSNEETRAHVPVHVRDSAREQSSRMFAREVVHSRISAQIQHECERIRNGGN